MGAGEPAEAPRARSRRALAATGAAAETAARENDVGERTFRVAEVVRYGWLARSLAQHEEAEHQVAHWQNGRLAKRLAEAGLAAIDTGLRAGSLVRTRPSVSADAAVEQRVRLDALLPESCSVCRRCAELTLEVGPRRYCLPCLGAHLEARKNGCSDSARERGGLSPGPPRCVASPLRRYGTVVGTS